MINKLINLANYLDESGFKKEADRVDVIIHSYASTDDKDKCLERGADLSEELTGILEEIKTAWNNLDIDSINMSLSEDDKKALSNMKGEQGFKNYFNGISLDLNSNKQDWTGTEGACGVTFTDPPKIKCDSAISRPSTVTQEMYDMGIRGGCKTKHEIASVIAHEVAHVILHSQNWLTVVDDKINYRMSNQEREHQADELGLILAQSAGYTFSLGIIHRLEEKGGEKTPDHPLTESRVGGKLRPDQWQQWTKEKTPEQLETLRYHYIETGAMPDLNEEELEALRESYKKKDDFPHHRLSPLELPG